MTFTGSGILLSSYSSADSLLGLASPGVSVALGSLLTPFRLLIIFNSGPPAISARTAEIFSEHSNIYLFFCFLFFFSLITALHFKEQKAKQTTQQKRCRGICGGFLLSCFLKSFSFLPSYHHNSSTPLPLYYFPSPLLSFFFLLLVPLLILLRIIFLLTPL